MELLFMYLGYGAAAAGIGLMMWLTMGGPTDIAKQIRLAKEAERDAELAKLKRAQLDASP